VSAMSATQLRPVPGGSAPVLMFSTAVMAAAAAAVLAVGTQDARLLRLGVIAALWAALLGAFAAARMRREARSNADHADQLRRTYQLELEREVSARREHELRVEHQLRERAEQSARREMVELRAELAAMRANLESLGHTPSARQAALGPGSDRPSLSSGAPWGSTGLPGLSAPQFVAHSQHAPQRHVAPVSHDSSPRVPHQSAAAGQQRTVDDLLAAHGNPRRRRGQRF
ncbi:MAG TPA: DUF6779 domain-containing protein, partial [Pseudonocardiaceae bacterium]|nr:DUF6779 domain-containing protein [Pseudonocardiaceae bacterium]